MGLRQLMMAGGGGGAPTDPNYSSVVSLLHFDGADGSTTFTDQKGKTWTAGGNAQIDTAQSKFGGASLLLDGAGDYILSSPSADFNFGTGDFTIEAWVYVAADSAQSAASNQRIANIFGLDNATTIIGLDFSIQASSSVTGTGLGIYNGTTTYAVTGTISKTVWHHIAASRSGNDLRFFLNGTQMGATQNVSGASFGSSTLTPKAGGRNFGSNYNYYLNGYIDDLRITKGVGRYTADFTPPTAAFPDS